MLIFLIHNVNANICRLAFMCMFNFLFFAILHLVLVRIIFPLGEYGQRWL